MRCGPGSTGSKVNSKRLPPTERYVASCQSIRHAFYVNTNRAAHWGVECTLAVTGTGGPAKTSQEQPVEHSVCSQVASRTQEQCRDAIQALRLCPRVRGAVSTGAKSCAVNKMRATIRGRIELSGGRVA
eukprot:690812-Pyramimonas_sp.AAC.1